MITPLVKPMITPEELLEMPDTNSCELIDGQLMEKNVSTLSCLVETLVLLRVGNHCQHNKLGFVWGGTMGFQCFPDAPRKVRKPDVSFVKEERMKAELLATGFLPIAPDLAVEVISPGDLAHEVIEKIQEYLRAGVPLIWIIDPESRVVQVYRKNGNNSQLGETDELLGEEVVPGFRCRVSELFPPGN